MNANLIVIQVAATLEKASLPYILVGSYSSNAYGVARSTNDADFVIELGHHSIAEIAAALGPEFSVDPQSILEFNTFTTRYVVVHRGSTFKIELFVLSEDPHDQERFRRRVRMALRDVPVWMPAAEDVVIMKLRWAIRAARAKDREDAYNVLWVQKGKLDYDYLRKWCDMHGTRQLLEDLLAKVP